MLVRGAARLPPQAHQGMLDERQGVDLGAALVDQANREVRRDLAAEQACGLADGAQQGVVTDAGQKILGVVDQLGEAFEMAAVAEMIGAHREDGVDALGRPPSLPASSKPRSTSTSASASSRPISRA